jgi:hypothetical protein
LRRLSKSLSFLYLTEYKNKIMKCAIPRQVGLRKMAFFGAAFLQALFGALTLVFHEEFFGKLLNSVR